MPIGISLHIGLNRVSESHYAGWSGQLRACESDANDMRDIAVSRGFESHCLLTSAATRENIARFIATAAARLRSGDIFLLSYSGHGGQVPSGAPDEQDGLDETWCLYDAEMLDDEVFGHLCGFRPGVKVIVVSDSCHSGSVVKGARAAASAPVKAIPPEVATQTYLQSQAFYSELVARAPVRARRRLRASVLLMSACQDSQTAGDGDRNGVFTGLLRTVWSAGTFEGSYRDLHQAITKLSPSTQSPNLIALGRHADALADAAAFAIDGRVSPATEVASGLASHMALSALPYDAGQAVPLPVLELISNGGLPLPEPEVLTRYNSAMALRALYRADGAALEATGAASRGGTVVRTFWWGFHIEVSHEDLQAFLASADPINAVIGALGGGIPSPAAPFIALAAAFVAGALGLLRSVDQGNGVYISMSWFAPGAFVPTSVPRRAVAAAHGTTVLRDEPVEFASGVIGFGPNWREDRLIDVQLPKGAVRDGDASVYASPGSNGNCYFVRWYNPEDPRDARFYLHIGSPFFGGGGQCVWVVNGHYQAYDLPIRKPHAPGIALHGREASSKTNNGSSLSAG